MQLQGEDPESECSICFEKKMDTSTIGNPSMCRHWETICRPCIDKLRKDCCPFCQQDWSRALGKKNMEDIWYAVLYMIVVLEDDVPLLSHLLDKRGFQLTEPYPFEIGCQFLTGETDVKEGAKVWDALPATVRQKMKATFLKAQDIEWDSANQSYVTRF